MTRLLLLALPGGAAIYAASLLLRCPHQRELWDRVDGAPVLRCEVCHRTRPNLLGSAVPAYHRTQDANHPAIPDSSTGIERAQAESEEHRRVIAQYEREQRLFVVGEKVRRKYEARV